ncbi:MAG: hypothetical protein MUE42_03755 [Opitutaceae bacterium]|nr:hypothetical protein [Opitutaceae bacterium]
MKTASGSLRRLSLLLLAALAAAPTARAAIEFSYRFSSGALIPDSGQLVDTRLVTHPGLTSISAVSLDLDLASAPGDSMWLGDLYATLTHGTALENERVAVLLNRPGRDPLNPFGSALHELFVTLDDAASDSVYAITGDTGTYRPDGRLDVDPYAAPVAYSPGTQTLSALTGPVLASGTWSLLLADTSAFDAARLNSWTLRLTGTVMPGAPITIPSIATARFSENFDADITLAPGAGVEFSGAMTGLLTTAAGSTIRLGPFATLGPAPFTLSPGATLSGTGVVSGPAVVSGDLTPGNSPGILTFTAGLTLTGTSTTSLEIAGPDRGVGYDGINLTTAGALTYGGTLSLHFGVPVAPGTYNFFNRTAPVTQSGDFAQLTIGGTAGPPAPVVFTAGQGWSVVVDDHYLRFSNESGDLIITPIPEPAAQATLLALAALALALGASRPRRAGK